MHANGWWRVMTLGAALGMVLLMTAPTRAAPPRKVRVFVLAGQSNMEGTGFVSADPQRNGGQGYHWNTNAETYYLIGEAMGQAMVKLLEPGVTD
ncbi:MAG: hypothetical protein ACK5EA_22025 [Planctomycetaceae bacterium]